MIDSHQEDRHAMDESTLLRAIASLKDELVLIINAGLERVQTSVAQLQAQQSEALLEQERRNSTFASREQVEAIARDVSRHGDEIARLHNQDDRSVEDRKELHAILAAATAASQQHRIDNLSKGYAAMGAAALGLMGFLLQLFFHFFH